MDFSQDYVYQNYAGFFEPFGAWRTSQETNRMDVEFIHDLQPLLVDDISAGSGSVTHNANPRDVTLSVGAGDEGDQGGLRTKAWVPYTPGAGQVVEMTGVLDNASLGGGTAQVFLRTSISGSVVTNTYDIDTWDAYGSGAVRNLDFTKSQIYAINFQSLKVGVIKFGLVRNGTFQAVHILENDNVRQTGYWQYASLPMTWRIYNTATQTIAEIGYGDDSNGVGFRYVYDGIQATATARAICGTVKSANGERVDDLPGFSNSISNAVTAKTVSTTLIPVLSIRVAATINSLANRGLYIPQGFSLQTSNPIQYKILLNPSLTGPSWTAVDATYSGMEYDVTASAVSGGVAVDTDYLGSGVNQRVAAAGILSRIYMSLGASPDILTIAAIRTAAADASVLSALKWKEIR